ncbi:hypothetical protein KAI65_02165 [Candidatus Parcubacteria bacterium]|nr:hypothetical protein [Candidatus Parcubacteria bacterium]
MKYYELNNSEKEILKDYDKGEFSSVAKDKDRKKYQEYVKNTVNKTKNINIRLSERDIQKIKAKALRKGIPYQTLITSLVHQYADK